MEHQNTIRVWYSPLSGVWHARIGGNDIAGREAEGLKAIEAVSALLVLLQWDTYAFDANVSFSPTPATQAA